MQQKQTGEMDGKNTMRSELEKHQRGTEMESDRFDYRWLAYVGLSALGGIVLWANRARIRSFLRTQGITSESVSRRAQAIKHSIGDAVQSGVHKVTQYAKDLDVGHAEARHAKERFESNLGDSPSGTSQQTSVEPGSRILHS